MDSRRPISGIIENEDCSSDEESSRVLEVGSDSTSSTYENVDVVFLLVEKEIEEVGVVAFVDDAEKECIGTYETIEELMQPKVEASKK